MAAVRKLIRSSDDRILGGVCAGLAEYFNLDPTLVRAVFVLVSLLGGSGLLAYLVLWLIMPVKEDKPVAAKTNKVKARSGNFIAFFLIGLGAVLLLKNFGVTRMIHFRLFWPLLLVFGGIVLFTKKD